MMAAKTKQNLVNVSDKTKCEKEGLSLLGRGMEVLMKSIGLMLTKLVRKESTLGFETLLLDGVSVSALFES
jgi:hypothetical protein